MIAITTYSALLSSPDAPRDQFRNNTPTDIAASSSWLAALAKLVVFCGVAAGLLYGYKQYALRGGKGFPGMGRAAPALGGAFYDSKRF